MKRRLLLPILALVLGFTPAAAQMRDTIRVCSWNVLNYTTSTDTSRRDAMRLVIGTVAPDLLVVQEIQNVAGYNVFTNDVIASSGVDHLTPSSFVEGDDSDNAIYYDSTKLEEIGHRGVEIGLRLANEWTGRVRLTGDTVRVYVLHLKAGSDTAAQRLRSEEATALRSWMDQYDPGSYRIVAGDLNVYRWSEPAYQTLTLTGIVPGSEVFDPIDVDGAWHADADFAEFHTQSTRTRAFGGGATGGLDDRFDFILLSPTLLGEHFLSGSYVAVGNDGRHFNDSINAPPHDIVPIGLANALHTASDHLPIRLDLEFTERASGVAPPRREELEIDLVRQ